MTIEKADWLFESDGFYLKFKVKNREEGQLFCGSSAYDTAQMSRLIDNIVQECKAQDIETMPPEKLDRLKEMWK